MSEALRSEMREEKTRALDAFRAVLRNPGLRRLQLAWAGSNLGTWGYGIALSVYAYDHGGATAVGVVGLIRLIPAAIAAPFMGVLGDRHSRRLVMALSDLGRVVVVGLGAIAIYLELSPGLVYLLAAIGVVVSTAFRPAQAAIIPSLASTPEELTASNVVSSTIESLGMFAGPAVGGVILAVSGPAAVFAVAALTFLWSALLILRIPHGDDGRVVLEEGESHPSFLSQAISGFGTVAKESAPRLLVGLFSAQTLIAGALLVLEVVVALELLGRGDAWVGVLSASFGVGGIVGRRDLRRARQPEPTRPRFRRGDPAVGAAAHPDRDLAVPGGRDNGHGVAGDRQHPRGRLRHDPAATERPRRSARAGVRRAGDRVPRHGGARRDRGAGDRPRVGLPQGVARHGRVPAGGDRAHLAQAHGPRPLGTPTRARDSPAPGDRAVLRAASAGVGAPRRPPDAVHDPGGHPDLRPGGCRGPLLRGRGRAGGDREGRVTGGRGAPRRLLRGDRAPARRAALRRGRRGEGLRGLRVGG